MKHLLVVDRPMTVERTFGAGADTCVELVGGSRKSHALDADGQILCGPITTPHAPGVYYFQMTIGEPTCGWCQLLKETQ